MDETLDALIKVITSDIYYVGNYCAITASLRSKKTHELVFYCKGSHLKSKFAVEQTKFLVGIKR